MLKFDRGLENSFRYELWKYLSSYYEKTLHCEFTVIDQVLLVLELLVLLFGNCFNTLNNFEKILYCSCNNKQYMHTVSLLFHNPEDAFVFHLSRFQINDKPGRLGI